ncbi:MAG: hypothetical protein QOH61_732 [Chloroflexota bacterium]|jgi:hypothetical protein|nr:hypothetical protein [Chloroflexota bacterium]
MLRRRWSASLLTTLVAAGVLAGTVPAVAQSGSSTAGNSAAGSSSRATTHADASSAPSVRLIAPNHEVKATRFPGQPIYVDPGIFLASVGGAFQINAERPDYDHPVQAVQVIHGAGGDTVRNLPTGMVTTLDGLPDFFHVVVRKENGKKVADQSMLFCPAGIDQRHSSGGPSNPTYPRGCFTGPFTLGQVWGIDRGWAVSAFGWMGLQFSGKNGSYHVQVSIGKAYREFFGISNADAVARITLKVSRDPFTCRDICPGPDGAAGNSTGLAGSSRTRSLTAAPVDSTPDPSTLPDLISLPGWSISMAPDGGRDYISFAATIWNAGPAPLVVEGYRKQDQAVMKGWQYFYDLGGNVVGRDRVGTLVYDAREGHTHWHFQQFATYSLLDASQQNVVVSQKEAFCLAPTDGIDMTVPGAAWNPGSTGLGTACGDANAIWTREVLHTGWGDTYIQSLPGQSLDITDLPNGIYYVSIEANPDHVLFESDYSNNRELRRIHLGGTPGHRTVVVKPWHGINA